MIPEPDGSQRRGMMFAPGMNGDQEWALALRIAQAYLGAERIYLQNDPDDIPACKAICWFVCRSPFDRVRERAIEAIRQAGDRLNQH